MSSRGKVNPTTQAPDGWACVVAEMFKAPDVQPVTFTVSTPALDLIFTHAGADTDESQSEPAEATSALVAPT